MFEVIAKEKLISAIRGLNMKDFTVKELEFLNDLLKVKSRQIEGEIIRRNAEGKE